MIILKRASNGLTRRSTGARNTVSMSCWTCTQSRAGKTATGIATTAAASPNSGPRKSSRIDFMLYGRKLPPVTVDVQLLQPTTSSMSRSVMPPSGGSPATINIWRTGQILIAYTARQSVLSEVWIRPTSSCLKGIIIRPYSARLTNRKTRISCSAAITILECAPQNSMIIRWFLTVSCGIRNRSESNSSRLMDI